MAETLENQALHLLGQVMNDSKGENIVALGMVKNINAAEGKIDCILEFDEIDQKKMKKYLMMLKLPLMKFQGLQKSILLQLTIKKI